MSEPILQYSNGYVEGYYCSQCNGYNDILNLHCVHCNDYRDREYNHLEFEFNTILRRGIIISYEKGFHSNMDNNKRVELHSQFYAQAGKLIESMTYDQLLAWEEELETIVIEAKASMQRSSAERREKQQRMSKEERDRLISNPELSVSDGLLAPKLRKDRMSKADKITADMAGMGIPLDMINQLMNNIIPGKTAISEIPEEKKSLSQFSFNREVKPNGNTQESLLADLLSMVDLSESSIDRLQEKLNTAELLLSKTVEGKKAIEDNIPIPIPDKMVEIAKRIEELRKSEHPFEKLNRENPSRIDNFDPSKLFGG